MAGPPHVAAIDQRPTSSPVRLEDLGRKRIDFGSRGSGQEHPAIRVVLGLTIRILSRCYANERRMYWYRLQPVLRGRVRMLSVDVGVVIRRVFAGPCDESVFVPNELHRSTVLPPCSAATTHFSGGVATPDGKCDLNCDHLRLAQTSCDAFPLVVPTGFEPVSPP